MEKGIERLSYMQSNEESHISEMSECAGLPRNLIAEFNQTVAEELSSENLKVYLRIRPLIKEESFTQQGGSLRIDNTSVIVTAPSKGKYPANNKVDNFKFSHIYDESTTQKTLFEETSQHLVQDLIDGQSCLLFSYGATNSGKTYTMQGSYSEPGMLPRTLDQIFRLIGDQQYSKNDLKPQYFSGVLKMSEKQAAYQEEEKLEVLKRTSHPTNLNTMSHSTNSSLESIHSRVTESGIYSNHTTFDDRDSHQDYQLLPEADPLEQNLSNSSNMVYAVFVSFAEIYNELIYDLLEKTSSSKACKKTSLSMGEDINGGIYIKGLREIRVNSREEALKILDVGKANLHFAATKLNHHSSRSHSVFTVKLVKLSDSLNSQFAVVSMLSLCDLAGAERNSKTQSTTLRLKEAGNINVSLLVLGQCMEALRQNQISSRQIGLQRKPKPIPYRDSKITRLFQSFFMGKGKVSMIVNVAFSSHLFDETLKVLKFSALARKVEIIHEKRKTNESFLGNSKKSSRFSQLVKQSLDKSGNSSRLSVPWANKRCTEMTFGEPENANVSTVEEEDEYSDNEEDVFQPYKDVIELLKKKLIQECKEKEELEAKIRKEVCDAFSKQNVKNEREWESRLEDERARKDEMMERRLQNLAKLYEANESRKRPREDFESSNEQDQDMVPALRLAREEDKNKKLQEEINELTQEVEALKAAYKSCNKLNRSLHEAKTQLTFEAATLKEQLELVTSRQNEEEISKLNEMLLEAADLYRVNEKTIFDLKNALSSEKEQHSQAAFVANELETQLSETKAMLSTQIEYVEERESELEELRSQIEILNKDLSRTCSQDLPELIVEQRKNKLLTSQNEEFEIQVSTLMKEIKALASQVESSKSENTLLASENAKLKADLADVRGKNENILSEKETLMQKVLTTQTLQRNELDLLKKVKQLKEDLSAKDLAHEKELSNMQKLSAENIQLEKELQEVKQNLESKVNQLEEDSSAKDLAHEKELSNMQKLSTRNNQLEEELLEVKQNLELKVKQLIEDLSTKDLAHAKEISNMEKLSAENIQLKEELLEVKQNLESKEDEINSMRTHTMEKDKIVSGYLETIDQLRQEAFVLNKHLSDQKSLTSQLKNTLQTRKKDVCLIPSLDPHLSCTEEWPVVLSTLEDTLNQVPTLRNQISNLESQGRIKESENTELKDTITILEETISKLKIKMEISQNSHLELEACKEQLISQKEALSVENDNLKSETQQLKNSQHSSFNKQKEDLENRLKVLEKELAATREARLEEGKTLRDQLEIKDQEINSLEQELKKKLVISSPHSSDKSTSTKSNSSEIKQEIRNERNVETLEKLLSSAENDKDVLKDRLCCLQQELEDARKEIQCLRSTKNSYRSRKLSHHSPEISSFTSGTRTRVDSSVASEASDGSVRRHPMGLIENAGLTRASRNRTKKLNLNESNTPERLCLRLDSVSDNEDNSSTRVNKNLQKKSTSTHGKENFKVPSSKSKGLAQPRDLSEDVFSDEDSDGGSDYVPPTPTPRKSSRANRCRGRSTLKKSHIFNPHIASGCKDESSRDSPKDQSQKDSSSSRYMTRSRGRRPLYSKESENTLEQSPDLLSNLHHQNDTPHSLVRRTLRSKK